MEVVLNILSGAVVYAPQKIENLEEKRIVPKMMLRRRLTRNAKMMLYLADKCSFHSGKIVYGSAFGELQATVGITDAILEGTSISPTLFQNSVYNSAPSYFSLLNTDRDEILTVSSGMNSSRDVLKTAALQALVSKEKILCVATECLDIHNVEEVNHCTSYLESGAAIVIEVSADTKDACNIDMDYQEKGVIASLQDLFCSVKMFENGKKKVRIEL